MKTRFIELLQRVSRPGAASLLAWLENESDFFTAPASTKYHGSFEGGLLAHTLNVYDRLRQIAIRDKVANYKADDIVPGLRYLDDAEEETVAVLALLHDICKVNTYQAEMARKKVAGQWQDVPGYTTHDTLPLGHGEKSLYLIQKHMDLAADEALAIRWHMGAYDHAVRGGSYALNAAMSATPWVWRLQEADMCAAHIDEREE